VRHYAGGLKEWFEHAPPASAPAVVVGRARRLEGPAAHDAGTPYTTTRVLDALAAMSVAALFRLWISIVIGCGAVYWVLGFAAPGSLATASGPIGAGLGGLLSALYFSAVTATSVGYGDIVPAGAARLVAIVESVAGLVFFGCVVSKFVSRRQEQLIDDIHHIAFEERLGRVRTNLLLVRSELQATSRLCEGQDIAPPEAMARVESAAMVFVGELHAVHDLLYRPQRTPDEAMFEAILAGLTSVFREFIELLTCVRGQRGVPTPALEASVAAMARLAREICGECVPRAFAPALRTWMDRIQRMAGEVEQI